MEALVVRRLGDPTLAPGSEASPFAEISRDYPVPELSSPTAVRVRVAATSLNFATFLQVQGKYQERPPLPFVPGSDYAGVVDAVGPGVRRFRSGDRVCSFTGLGSFAEFIVAEEKELFLVPEGCDLIAAGALPVAFGTSHVALVHRAQLKAGQLQISLSATHQSILRPSAGVEVGQPNIGSLHALNLGEADAPNQASVATRTRSMAATASVWAASVEAGPLVLLVLGAAGGVGVSAVQIGKVCGAVVIAVARGPEKLQYLQSIGADHVIDSSKDNIIESAKFFLKARGLKGVDVLYDPVGGKLTQDSLKLLKWGAHILVIGFASGDVPIIRANVALVKAHLAFAALRDRKAVGKVMIVMDASVKSRL
ncbi:hypothetical protein PR202_ga04287 [Eleusine coracana subsp. coracana]|uniref:Enoyl reductase (ER) domain-containing protein n=1 Tax=Eleusine coracana subsp. coracana TaxID=191504 RepID=A0AAV5BQN9_ELECO|nr:hypothetical protein PR202_ga04287 [Eleusine coracana subsp. coracana]